MAKQKGIFKVQGSVGGVNFYKSQDGYLLRELTTLDGNRIKTDPAFKRTRENGSEFSTAAKAGKFFRLTFKPVLKTGSDNRIISRLMKGMVSVLRVDTTHVRGKRVPSAGDLTLLKGFECNDGAPLSATLELIPATLIDRVTGKATVAISSFVPSEDVNAPVGTTHFKIVTAAAAIDFDNGTQTADFKSTAMLPWDVNPTAAINLQNNLPAASTLPLFLLLGIQFFRVEGTVTYPLNTKSANALQIAQVDA